MMLAAGKRGEFFPDVAEIVFFPNGGRGVRPYFVCVLLF